MKKSPKRIQATIAAWFDAVQATLPALPVDQVRREASIAALRILVVAAAGRAGRLHSSCDWPSIVSDRNAMYAITGGAVFAPDTCPAIDDAAIPAEAIDLLLPLIDGNPVDALGTIYEQLHADRRRGGVFFTPPGLVSLLVEEALRDAATPPSVWDPACGTGNLLLAMARALRERFDAPVEAIVAHLEGTDIDPVAADLCRWRFWIETGSMPVIRIEDALLAPSGGQVDVVIANPPFGNAIEHETGRTAASKRLFRTRYPTLAFGPYERSSLFVGAAVNRLRPGGRLSIVLPRAILGAEHAAPLRRYLLDTAPPDRLTVLDDGWQFNDASVFICVLSATRGVTSSGTLVDGRVATLPAGGSSWWPVVAGGPAASPDHTIRLGEVVDAWAGCSTGVAYTLAKHLDGDGMPLVTSGSINRFSCAWGVLPQRILGRSHLTPRWPAGIDPAADRARARQARPKVLVAGLSRVIEAMNDPDGRYAGFVSTHVLIPRSVSGAAITAILNSAAFSYLHLREFGAKQMTGGSCTIGKKELLATPIPAAILDPAVDRLVQDTPDGDELHALISRLYGLCESDAAEIYQWWDVRSRAARRGGDARERANR